MISEKWKWKDLKYAYISIYIHWLSLSSLTNEIEHHFNYGWVEIYLEFVKKISSIC